MPKYLDNDGLLYFWQKIKNTFALLNHTHAASTITTSNNSDVETELGALDDVIATKANATHSHAISDVANLQTQLNGKAPTSHASATTTYGGGSTSILGHVKLSDAIDGNQTAAAGNTAASPKAVKDALAAAKTYTDDAIDDIEITDEKVKYNASTSTTATPIVLAPIGVSDGDAAQALFSSKVKANPNTGNLLAEEFNGVQVNVSSDLGIRFGDASTAQLKVPHSKNYVLGDACAKAIGAVQAGNAGLVTGDAVNTAINSAVTGLYKYKGSVASEAQLPTTGQSTGDVYNIESASSYGAAGANVAWNGSAWDSLGEIFTINSITNGEIDTIVAS